MGPEGLVAQSLMIGTPDLYDISMYRGGAFMEDIVINWVKGTAPDNWEYQLDQIAQHSKKDEFHNSTCLSMGIGPTYNKIDVAAIHIGGWYDPFCQGTLNGYMGYDDLGTENARGKQLLIMTPSTHGFPGEGKQGELEFPTQSTSGIDLYMSWEQNLLDYALLGKNIDWTGNRVAYYVMGDVDDETINANDYRYASDWPIPHTNDTWYLSVNNEMLKNDKGSANSKMDYLYDSRNPVPTIGGNNLLIASGPYDQRDVEDRDDVLVFETETFTSPYEIIGRMWAHLTVSSNCTNTDFTVKICDVYPDGRSILISDGIINVKRRDGFNINAPPLNQAGIVELDIDLWSTAYQINTGHKLRVSISSSNYPRFAINPNTGAEQQVYSYQYLERNIAKNSIYVGPGYNTYLLLPNPI